MTLTAVCSYHCILSFAVVVNHLLGLIYKLNLVICMYSKKHRLYRDKSGNKEGLRSITSLDLFNTVSLVDH